MDDQNDLGAQNNEIIKPASETIPAVIIAKEIKTAKTSIPLIERKWFKITCSFAVIVLVVGFIASSTEIPNNVMSWFINYKNLSENGAKERPALEPIFSVVGGVRVRELGGLWFVFGSGKDAAACPIFEMIYIELTNLKSTPRPIDIYSIEAQQPDGSWKITPSIDIRRGIFIVTPCDFTNGFAIPNFSQAKIEAPTEIFDSAIENKIIAPNETVKGWIFLDQPKGTVFSQNAPLRFKLNDSAGATSVETIKAPPERNKWDTVLSGSGKFIASTNIDLTGIHTKIYSELW